ncbi:phospho-sugar mutase [Acetobacterium woodii]|uniref:Phosphoglucomutase n=1 Tax=Acetobacterium woodii (strain ATCC 29683 / DSM 1030 / JCM 2381 / KCTC 1655 / WB1) TaxID=931626 RepID=H6LGA0_ACEWD|nr:phospho-sugar mutase [Acetobacterium woodii]AFA47036.1 phosphoglucomutase Pgm1 [Acetobacterium woodii DSM 1030]
MNYQESYQNWLNQKDLDIELRQELEAVTDEKEIEDRFYMDLEFGTGGMRGKMGAGSNRMNIYTVAKVTYGLGKYLLRQNMQNWEKGVVIAYDSRHNSRKFAETAACVLGKMGVAAYLFEELRPTPELSFAVRNLKAAAGIVITASHNPKEYNGYKVYGPDGGQMVTASADALIAEIGRIDDIFDIPIMPMVEGLNQKIIQMIGIKMDNAFTDAVTAICYPRPNSDLKVVYTPLHGAGNKPVRRVLEELGYSQVTVVPEQELPDGDFTTTPYPNPEDRSVFTLAMKLADEIGADIIIGTDPDCDRVGVVGRNHRGQYEVFTGNQTGALLIDYYLKTRKDLPANKVVIKTIVTSELGGIVAKSYGATVIDVLTGFKYIGECMTDFEKTGDYTFVFGYEESYGYLAGNYARDKDAVIASALVCEMTDYYKQQGLTLHEALQSLYQKYGYFIEDVVALTLEGIEGKTKIEKIMDTFRKIDFPGFAEAKLVKFNDYETSVSNDLTTGLTTSIELPKSNVLKFVFDDHSWFALRPSGTEPKLKMYFSVTGKTQEEALAKKELLKKQVTALI